MKKMFFLAAILTIAGCSCTTQLSSESAEQKMSVLYKSLDEDYFDDVLTEGDAYWDYMDNPCDSTWDILIRRVESDAREWSEYAPEETPVIIDSASFMLLKGGVK